MRSWPSRLSFPHTRVDYYYSLGWEVITVGGSIDSYYKAGRWFNQASGLQVFPKRKIAFIYLCNPPEHLGDSFMSWRQGLTGMLRFLVRKISGDETLCTAWPSLTPDELKWYEGDYRNVITGEKVHVSLKGGTLFSNGFGGYMPLRTFTSNRFPHRQRPHAAQLRMEGPPRGRPGPQARLLRGRTGIARRPYLSRSTKHVMKSDHR